jgi:hypothetical protein
MQQDNRNISTRETTREVNRAETSILYLGLVGKDYIASPRRERFETAPVWSHIRRCAGIEDPFGRVETYSVSNFLDGSHRFGTISISPGFKLFTLSLYMTGRSSW